MRRSRLALVAGIGAALAAAALAVQRIPAGSVGIRDGSLLPSGLAVGAPWNRATVVPGRGDTTVPGLRLATPEGSSLSFDLDASWRVARAPSGRFLSDLREGGVPAALATLASHVVTDVGSRRDAESILSDPSILEGAVRAAIESSGLAVDRLRVRSAQGDEALYRRRTAEASSLARPPLARRVLVVGWDGADWRILDPLMRAGKLPNLARLVRDGARADLRSYDPMFSPLLWTSVATGKPPTQHGIADFLVRDPATGTRRPITSEFRKVKALWNIFGDFGRESSWIGWWATFPAEPIRGVMVTELLAHTVVKEGPEKAASRKSLVFPEDWLKGREGSLFPPSRVSYDEVRSLFPLTREEFLDARARAPTDEPPSPTSKEPPEPVVFTIKLLSAMHTYHALALDLLKSGNPFVSVYYEGPDMMGHRFQHYLPPKMAMVTTEEFERFRNAVPRYFEIQDRMLGELLAAAGPDTDVVLLSDHGFRTGDDRPEDVAPYTTGQPAEWHRPWGILVLSGPSFRPVDLGRESIYDVTPTLLYLEGLPIARDMRGRIPAAALRPEVLRSAPPREIGSYELVGSPMERREPASVDPESMAEMMANLRALGYVGGETNDTAPAPPGAPGSRAAAPTSDPQSQTQVFYHRNLAVQLIKSGDLDGAERELLAANEREPLGKTYAMLGEVRARRGGFREAASAIEDGLKTVPKMMESESLLWLAEMYLKAGDLDAAARVPQRFPDLATPGVSAAVSGRVADARGDRAAARERFEAALEADPLLVHIALRLSEIYRDQGEPYRIEPFLAATVARHPKVDAYQSLLGDLDLSRGDAAGAAKRYRSALESQPDNPLYLGRFASAAAALSRRDEARAALEWAARSDSSDPEAWMAVGAAWDRLGETNRALDAFAKARGLGMSSPAPEVGAILALARSGRTGEAKARLDEARSRYPESRALADLASRLR